MLGVLLGDDPNAIGMGTKGGGFRWWDGCGVWSMVSGSSISKIHRSSRDDSID